jgi:hypothetical protein
VEEKKGRYEAQHREFEAEKTSDDEIKLSLEGSIFEFQI